MDFLEDYNSNLYLKICSFLNNELDQLFFFISDLRKKNNYSDVLNLEHIYNEIFSSPGVRDSLELKIDRVLNPHYSIFDKIKPESGNSSYFIGIKIKRDSVKKIDLLYNKQLTSLLRLYKNIFTVIDKPDYMVNEEDLKKYEELINDVRHKMNDFLLNAENKQLIESRDRLKSNFIKNLPYRGFYHMTHIDNLESILFRGLLSNTLAYKNKLVRVDISNNKIQKERNRKETVFGRHIHEYVPLYINPKNPMMISEKVNKYNSGIVLLEIIPHILVQKENTLFSDGNAAQLQTNFYHNQSEMENVNWRLLQEGSWIKNTESHRIMCSEVLIPDAIEVYFINKIIMRNDDFLENIMKSFPNHKGIELEIDDTFFQTTILN